MKRLIKKQDGFTLIEALLAIFVFAVGILGLSALAVNLYTTHSYMFEQSQAIFEARQGIKTMVKEIREAREGDDGSYIIEKADDYEFIFYSDIDDDNDTERVRYFLDGKNLKKGVIEPEGWPIRYPQDKEKISVITSYVRNQSPIFHYYDGDGNELKPPSRLKDTKMMSVYLVVNIDPNRPPQDFVLESFVQLRNLKTNL
ncbi:MAG: prepilin-type N-terminal cleavage/methylation domain-containing protein [Candidatus Pacebacteria bacterium]|nr:prepilin-type N-terminal cleavage/methylation domain-containing protein [Candidatus Paceibacterota bacterium]